MQTKKLYVDLDKPKKTKIKPIINNFLRLVFYIISDTIFFININEKKPHNQDFPDYAVLYSCIIMTLKNMVPL